MTNLIERCGDGSGGAGAAYSQVDGALLVKEVSQPRYDDVLEVFEIPANLTAGTYYFPGDAGFNNFGFQQSISLFIAATTGAGVTARFRVLATNHPTEDNYVNNTEAWETNSGSQVSEIVVAPDSTEVMVGIAKVNPEYHRYVLQIVIDATGTNDIYVAMLRKAK